MDPDLAAPQVGYQEVRWGPEQCLEGHLGVQCMYGCAVFEPSCVVQCLTPQYLGEASLMPEGTDTLKECLVKPLGNAIELQCYGVGPYQCSSGTV